VAKRAATAVRYHATAGNMNGHRFSFGPASPARDLGRTGSKIRVKSSVSRARLKNYLLRFSDSAMEKA
jgi:hypothetical protein